MLQIIMVIYPKVLPLIFSQLENIKRIDILSQSSQGQTRPGEKIQRDNRLQNIVFALENRT
jgi:hypothetical protein